MVHYIPRLKRQTPSHLDKACYITKEKGTLHMLSVFSTGRMFIITRTRGDVRGKFGSCNPWI